MTKLGAFSRAIKESEIGGELLPLIEIYGDSRVLIEHHKGIVQYGNSEIRARVRYGFVSVHGNNLTVLVMSKEKLIIGGLIDHVSICRGG